MTYVSITGLRLKAIWHYPHFMRLSIPAMAAAQSAEGCLSASARHINGVHHTLSVWTSREAMLVFMRGKAHRLAMKDLQKIATGKTYGAEMEEIPDWSEVHALWEKNARSY